MLTIYYDGENKNFFIGGACKVRDLKKTRDIIKASLMDGRGQGAAGGWIIGVIALFIIAVLWIIMSAAFSPMYSKFREIAPSLNATNETMTTFETVNKVWAYTPLLLMVAVIIFIIVSSMRREPYEYY